MMLLFLKFGLLFAIVATVSAYQCDVEEPIYGHRTVSCNISYWDLPMRLDDFGGHLDSLNIYGFVITHIPEAAFRGVTFDKVSKKTIIFWHKTSDHGFELFLSFKIALFQLVMDVAVGDSIDENFLTPQQKSKVTHIEFKNFMMK